MLKVRDEVITMKSCGLICASRSTAVSSNFQSGGSTTVLLVFGGSYEIRSLCGEPKNSDMHSLRKMSLIVE